MSSGIVLSETAQWLAPEWLARNVAAHVELWLDEYGTAGQSMKEHIRAFFSANGGRRLDLSGVAQCELEAFYRAVGTGYMIAT